MRKPLPTALQIIPSISILSKKISPPLFTNRFFCGITYLDLGTTTKYVARVLGAGCGFVCGGIRVSTVCRLRGRSVRSSLRGKRRRRFGRARRKGVFSQPRLFMAHSRFETCFCTGVSCPCLRYINLRLPDFLGLFDLSKLGLLWCLKLNVGGFT